MTEAATTQQSNEAPVDGRVARRRRNLDAVLDVVLEMFAEDMMFPSIEQAELTHLAHIGQGPFTERLDAFVSMRVRLYEVNGSMFRATIHNAANHPRVRDELNTNRRLLREQFELQFGPELASMSPRERSSAVEAGNVLTQIDSIDLLRRIRTLTVAETDAVLRDALTALLAPTS